VPDRNELIHGASDRIELLGGAVMLILAAPGMPEILTTKVADGCSIRILVYDTGPHPTPLIHQPGIEIRLLKRPAGYAIQRFDDELLLTLHMVAGDLSTCR
jgi:hypothetical protein